MYMLKNGGIIPGSKFGSLNLTGHSGKSGAKSEYKFGVGHSKESLLALQK